MTARMGLPWSPHSVAADLREDGKQSCAETIYQACYDTYQACYDTKAASGLPGDCWKLLPRCRRRRKPRGCRTRVPSPLGDFKPISQRPAAEQRSEAWPGRRPHHRQPATAAPWPHSPTGSPALTDRLTRQRLLAGLTYGHDADSTAEAVTAALSRQPATS